jgi:peptidoglycan/LPS O-acetylase OafA/YrhL
VVYWSTLTRLDGLAVGALIALYEPSLRRHGSSALRMALALLAVTLPIGFWMTFVGPGAAPQNNDPLINATIYSLLAVGFGSLLSASLLSPRVAAVFTPRWLRYVGNVSYGVYIYHYALILIAAEVTRGMASHLGVPISLVNGARWAVLLPLIFLVSEGSWRYFESPLLRLKARFE